MVRKVIKDDFANGIEDWSRDTARWVSKESGKMVRQLFHQVLINSPIESGRFVSNWHVGPTTPSYSVMTIQDYVLKVNEVLTTINDNYFLTTNKAYLVNNVDYAGNVEVFGWLRTPKYAPVGKAISSHWASL